MFRLFFVSAVDDWEIYVQGIFEILAINLAINIMTETWDRSDSTNFFYIYFWNVMREQKEL